MPYPRRLLNQGEVIALDLKPHWWYFSSQALSGVPLFVLFVFLVQISGTVQELGWWAWGAGALIWAGWLLLRYLEWNFTHFVVTSDRVVFRSGVLAKRGVEIPLDRINNINFSQKVWERIIGAGDLEVESAGKDGQSVFSDVRHPDAVQQELYRQMDENARRRAAWVGGARSAGDSGGTVVPEQLRQLADLRDRGVISPEEFEAKKAELLERM